MLETILILSLITNVVFLLYVRWLLKIIEQYHLDIDNIKNIIKDFGEHVKSIHEMEMFYGDQTLQALMKHGNEVVEILEDVDLVVEEDGTNEDPEA